jgi:hypothetical protein
MLQEISLGDARRGLPALLRESEADPAPARRKNPGAAMLKLASEMEKLWSPAGGEADVTAASYKEHLYGNESFAGSRKRR